MICTESEAKTKWCPQARIYARYAAFNRMTEEDGNVEQAKCIGSACMMWVWVADDMPNRMEVARDDIPQMVCVGFRREDPTEDELVYVWMVRDADCGTCGLIRSGS